MDLGVNCETVGMDQNSGLLRSIGTAGAGLVLKHPTAVQLRQRGSRLAGMAPPGRWQVPWLEERCAFDRAAAGDLRIALCGSDLF